MIPVSAVTENDNDAALEAAIKIANRHNVFSGAAENPAIPGVNGVDLAATIQRYEVNILGQEIAVWAEESRTIELLKDQAMAYQEIDPQDALTDAIRWVSRNHLVYAEVA